MKNSINKNELKSMMLYVASKIIENEPYLTEIDLKIGDGDHGTGMEIGFKAVAQNLPSYEPKSAEDVFCFVGTTLLDTMGGASGVLFGTMFISGITERTQNNELSIKDFAEIFRLSLDKLKKRGKAKIGDKTMVDSFEPAVVALEESQKNNVDLITGLKNACNEAKRGMEYTKECVAKFGRAKSYGEKAIGLQDAGATSVWIIFKAMSDWADSHL